jgi:hypothetical protein
MSRVRVLLWCTTVLLIVASTAMSVGRDTPSDVVLYATLPLLLATVGALVAARQPRNKIAWIFIGGGLYVAVAEIAEGYSFLAEDWALPFGDLGAWVISWSWVGELFGWAVVFLLFPDGRLHRRSSRWVLWLAGAGTVLAIPGLAFSPGPQDEFVGADRNPFAIESAVVGFVFTTGIVLLVVAVQGSVATFVLRLRRARGVERVQLKWFACGAALVALALPIAVLLWESTPAVHAAPGIAFNALLIAAGIAILRHGLYDIDVFIKRTLVYGALTALLLGTYLGSVLVFRLVLNPVIGDSDLAVAASTLAVAALFRPLRSRVQGVVDRRFYRRRYDAARTLEGFTGRLRHELDLETLATDLRVVVNDTMQPTQVSLWLRSPP